MNMIEAKDVVVGKTFEAKKPKSSGFPALVNDRQVIYVNEIQSVVQFDSPTVRFGSKHPTVSMVEFLKWAGRDVTSLMPEGEWRSECIAQPA